MNVEQYFTRIDQTLMCPWFLAKCKELVSNCLARGYGFYAISGYRSNEEQANLYAIGRTIDKDKPVVTNAKPYTSFHNYALAIDFTLDKDANRAGLQPDWDKEHYRVLQEEAHKLGLTSGLDFVSFPESPHIQAPFAAGTTQQMKDTLLIDNISKVWDEALVRLKASSTYSTYF